MKNIGKSYLKSFIKDIFILTLIILYLIIMFIVIFILSNTSLQMKQQYSEIKSKSNKWESSFVDNSNADWNITYIGSNVPNDENNFFNILTQLTDEDGHKLLVSDTDTNTYWYKTIYINQLGGTWDNISNPINLNDNKNNKTINTAQFNLVLNNDIKIMSQIGSKIGWENFKVPNIKTDINNVNLDQIFNPNANWSNINYSFYKALYEEISSNNYNKINSSDILGFNQVITLQNYIDESSLSNNKINDNNLLFSQNNSQNNDILQTKQELEINFTDNKYRNNMSKVFLQNNKGSMPKNNNEILVNKEFADKHHFKIGDQINLLGNNEIFNQINTSGKELVHTNFTIVGYGMSLSSSTARKNRYGDDYPGSELTGKQKTDFGNIYVTYSEYNKIKQILSEEVEEEKTDVFNFQWNIKNSIFNPILFFSNYYTDSSLISNNINQYNRFDNYIYDHKYLDLNSLSNISENWNNSAVNNQIESNKITIIINLIIFFFILGFSFIFLNLIIKRDINNSKRQLGIFKMLGYKTSELSLIYSYKVLITFFISSVLGYLISIPIQIYSSGYMFKTIAVILTITRFNYMPSLLFFSFVFIPILFTIISFLINLKYIKLPPLILISDNNKIKNVKILKWSKKIEIRKNPDLRLKKAFTIQNLWKWVSITAILSFSLLSLIVNASSNVSLDNYLKNSVESTLNKNTQTNYVANILTNQNTTVYKNYFQTNNYNQKFNPFEINNADNTNIQNNINMSLNVWHNMITNDINNWNTISIQKNPYVHIDDLQKIINKFYIEKSYNNIFENKITKNTSTLLMNLEYLYYNNSSNTIICLNNITKKYSNNFFSIENWITSLNIEKNNNEALSIYGLDDRNNYNKFRKFFNANQINEQNYNDIMKYSNDRTIPIIISKKISDIMNWKVNDLIKSTNTNNNINLISNINNNSNSKDELKNINLKIISITKDVYTTDIYTSYKNLAKFYQNKNNINYTNGKNNGTNYGLLNYWLNKINMYPNFSNLESIASSWNNLKLYFQGSEKNKKLIKTNDLNLKFYYIIKNQNFSTVNAGQYFENQNGLNDFFNITNVVNYTQLNNKINEMDQNLKLVNNLQIFFTLFLISILIIILVLIIVDENKKAIMILKVIGYKNKNINRITTSNIIIIMISSFIIGIILSKILLSFISNYVRIKFNFYIDLPLSANKIIEIAILVTIIFLTVWRIALNQIKKHKIEELEKLD